MTDTREYPPVGSWEFEEWAKEQLESINRLARENVERWEEVERIISQWGGE